MEVNTMLCVGRGRHSQFGKTHSSESGCHTPETKFSTEVNNGAGLTEKELVARVSSKLSQECLSPPTKSILRRVPSPKQGSPSSLRSVRFSEKECEDEIMYAKIHVNKNIQTEHIHKDKTHKETLSAQGFKLNLAQSHEEFNPKGVHELKTSTPRYSIFEETPTLDFRTPREHQEDRKSSKFSMHDDKVELQGKKNAELKENRQKSDNKHERIVFDINIDRKRPTERLTRPDKSDSKVTRNTQGQGKKPASRDIDTGSGNRIVQNMDLNRSLSKSPERPRIPDGRKIIQNLKLSCGDIVEKMQSTATQTSNSDISSPRSASPETPYENVEIPDGRRIIKNMELNSHDSSMKAKSVQTIQIPDGEKIIQNLELSSRDSSFKVRSESSQTVDIPDGRQITQNMELTNAQRSNRNTSIGIQAFDGNDIKEESVRSVLVQTDCYESEGNSSNESVDLSYTRSVAVQTQTVNRPTFPDGSKITRNMESHKSDKTKEFTDSRDDKKTLNDSNWNEFVRHLELFNPSQSSSSSASVSEEEISTSQTAEPILVYDRSAPSPETVKKAESISHEGKLAKPQRVSDRSAGTFLKSEAYTKHQYETVLKEEGLLSKYDIGQKASGDPSVSAKLLVEKAFAKNKEDFERTKKSSKKQNSVSTFSRQNNEQEGNQQLHQSRKIQMSTFRKEPRTGSGVTSGFNVKNQHVQSHTKSDKERLGFTPIETYSFDPEALMKTAAKRSCSSSKPKAESLKTTTPKTSISPLFGTKESVTKNSFIQGLDLGPVPRSLTTSRRYPSLLSHHMMSDRPETKYTSFCRSKYDNTFQTKCDKKYGKDFSERPENHENVSSLSLGNNRSSSQSSSLLGFQKSGYSHGTGPEQRIPSNDNRFSISQSRPYSAPSPRNRLNPSSSPLTSTLRDMRNNALRKNAMHQFSDLNKHTPTLVQSSSFSAPTHYTRVENQNTPYLKSSKFPINIYTRSHENSMQNQLRSTRSDISSPLTSQSSYRSKGRSCSPQRASSQRSDYMYLSALNDESNARPPSRERSRSRSMSPAQSPVNEFGIGLYEAPRHSSRQLDNLSKMNSSTWNHDEKKRFIESNEDRGSFDSFVSSGYQISHLPSKNIVERSSGRESRPLTRKPPLPRTRKSISNGRSRSRSTDSLSRENATQVKDLNKQNYHDDTDDTAKSISFKKEARSNLYHSAVDKNEVGTVTVGDVPSGLADPDSWFLGHDTIQKIIEEAKL